MEGQKTFRKFNTLDANGNLIGQTNNSFLGQGQDNTNMFRSQQQPKDNSTNLIAKQDEIIDQRNSFNDLGFENNRDKQEFGENEEEMILMNEKYQNRTIQVQYGSLITISLAEFTDCYIYSDGFSSKTIKLKEFKSACGQRDLDFFNSVFMILPTMEYKYQSQLLRQFVFPESKKNQGNEKLQDRKNKIQTLQQNIEGEFSANILNFNKLKGTPVSFSTSSFHLVHKASLKYLSVDDTNQDNYIFKFVDFPDQNCLFKFMPCLMFQNQRQTTSNAVFNKDNLYIVSSKPIHNRKPYIFTDYSGQKQINQINALQDESSYGKIYANLETNCRWRINIFQQPELSDKSYYMNVGDSVWLNLSEYHYQFSTSRTVNIYQRIKNIIYSSSDQQQSNNLNSNASETNINKNKSFLQNSQVSNIDQPNQLISPQNQNQQIQFSPVAQTNLPTNSNAVEKLYQKSTSIVGKVQRQFTQGEFLTPNYHKMQTLQVEDQNPVASVSGSRYSRQQSGVLNQSHEFYEEEDYDKNLDTNIKNLEIDIFHNAQVALVHQNQDDMNNFDKKDEGQKFRTIPSQYKNEKGQANQVEENDSDDEEAKLQDKNQKSQNLNTQGLWKIESEYFAVGGFLEWKQNYRLRHFATGKYLSIQKNNKGEIEMVLTSRPTPQTLFNFVSVQAISSNQNTFSKQKYISKDSFYCLKSKAIDGYIGIDQLKLVEENKCQIKMCEQQSQFNIFKMKKANFDDNWEINFLLCCVPILTESIKFINRIGQKQVLEKFQNNRSTYEYMFSRIKQVLRDIDAFICNTLTSNISVTEEYGKPSIERSNILREQHVIGILCLLLFKTYPREELQKAFNMEDFTERLRNEQNVGLSRSQNGILQYQNSENGPSKKKLEKMEEDVLIKKYGISILIYKIFQNVCFDNKQNQEYLFKFMSEFQKQVGSQDIVCESLINFFKFNRMIIQRFSLPVYQRKTQRKPSRIAPPQLSPSPSDIKQTGSYVSVGEEKTTHLNMIINKLISYQGQRKNDIIKLLTQFCKYVDRAIFNNQEVIFSNLIVKQQNNSLSPLFQIKLQGGESLTIQLFEEIEDKNIELVQFLMLDENQDYLDQNDFDQDGVAAEQEMNHEGEQNQHMKLRKKNTNNNFLMNQLNLYANLCLNRNYNCCNYFMEIFPLKTLIENVDNKLINDEQVKAAFLKLIHYIYLDKEPRTIQIKPNFIRIIDSEAEQLYNDKFLQERKRVTSFTYRESPNNNQNGIELQNLQIQPQASKLNKLNQNNQEALCLLQKVEGQELLATINEQDQNEINSLKKLKTDLLSVLMEKEKLLEKVENDTQDKIFNAMTYEVIKMLKMMLKFGIFNLELDMPVQEFRKKTQKTFMQGLQGLTKKEEPIPKTEVERLIEICVKILEFDQFYQQTLQDLKIVRRTEEKSKDIININFLKGGISVLGKGFEDMFKMGTKAGGKEKKNDTKKKNAGLDDVSADIVTDPLFKKIQGLKKVLNKYTNKTYLSKEELKKDQEEDFETGIKIEICQIFQELLNVQQDFYLDNTISFFKKNYFQSQSKTVQLKSEKKQNFCSLLPEDPFEVGKVYKNRRQFVNYTDKVPPKSFDEILDRSFMETLLISFYFADNPSLSNEIMNLIKRFSSQKSELIGNISKIELLLTNESKKNYQVLSYQVSRLKNLIQNSQIWLQISQNKESDIKMTQCLDCLQQIKTQLDFFSEETEEISEERKQQMKVSQSIFKHIRGDENILQLIERSMILFHSQKEIFFNNQQNRSEKISQIIQMVNYCYEILVLFCKYNDVHQELLFEKIFKLIIQFQDFNFGQLPLIEEIIKGNVNICTQLRAEDLKFIADFIVNHGKYQEFLNIFDIIIKTVTDKDDKQSKIMQSMVIKILFDDRISSKINPFNKNNEEQDENGYKFFDKEPNLKLYKEILIRLMSKGLDKDSDISLISKMNKVVTAENLFEELNKYQRESIGYERSQQNEETLIECYKKQKKMLKILLYYLTRSQKDYIESQFRGNKQLIEFIQLITDRFKEERLYHFKFQITLIDRIIPLINIYSELFLREQNLQITESQDFLNNSKNQFQKFTNEYIRQVEIFQKEKELIFTAKDAKYRNLLRLSNFYSVPIPKTFSFIKDQEDELLQNKDSEMGQFAVRLENSRLDSLSSLNSRRQNSFQMQNVKRAGSVTSRSKNPDQDDMSFEGEKLKKKQSTFNVNNNSSLLKLKKNGDRGSPLLQQNSPSQENNDKNLDKDMINFQIQKNNIAEEDMQGIEKANSNRLSNNKLLTVNLNKHISNTKPIDQALLNIQIKEQWDNLIEILKESKEIENKIEKEKSLLSNNILNVQNIFMADLKDHQKDILLNSEDMITKCLNYIEFWEKNHSDKNDIIFTIKSLSNILKLEDEDELDDEEQEKQEEEQFERQIMLDKLNATKICLLLISSDQMTVENDLLYYIIKFLILILDGGNQTVQKTIYEFFYSSLYSEFSEKFFLKIYNILNDQIMQETTGQKYIIGKKSDKIILKILRLLQLFCEGHNNNLQNLMRDQKTNKKSYNFIIQIIKLLSTYKIHNENYETVIQCFDTLTEFIQGPCQGNQQCIISSKFLDYAVLILSGDKKILDIAELQHQNFLGQIEQSNSQFIKKSGLMDSKISKTATMKEKSVKLADPDNNQSGFLFTDKDESQDQFPLHLGKLARLKNKCLITIVSLLECNINSKEFVTKIVRAIPLNVLTNNLSRIYSLYQKYEKGYVYSIFNRADDEIDPKKPPEYYELIIENGFNLYILVNLYLENKKGLDEEDDEIKEFFDEFAKEEEKGGLSGLLQNNILMDLTKVGKAFIGLGFGALKDVYKKAKTLGDKKMIEEQEQQIIEQENKETKKNAIKFFKEQVGRIEIVRDQQLQFIYFPILPFCKMLPEESNEDFRETVPRTSVKTQLSHLMQKSDDMIKVMQHEETLRQIFEKYKALGFLASHVRLWERIAFFFASAINIIILFSYSAFFATDEQKQNKDSLKDERLFDPRLFYIKSQTNTESYIITLGTITIIFYSIVVAVFLMKKAPILVGDIWEEYYNSYKIKKKKDKNDDDDDDENIKPLKWLAVLTSHLIEVIKKLMQFVINALKSVIIMLQDYEIVYYTFNTAVVIFGLTVHPFLFAGCLTDLLRTKVLKNVVAAVWIPKGEIFLLLLLFIIFQYYFSLIAYIYFNDHFRDNRCESLWRCFITVFDWTFKQNGGVGTSMKEPNSLIFYAENSDPPTLTNLQSTNYNGTLEQYTSVYFSRFVFDTITNIVLLFILINILKGIIVDKFKSLKDDMSNREEDEKFYCFVCGIHREILDKAQEKKGYMYHIKYEHYMWNYIYYRAYLESKDSTEYNGDESYVINKIQGSDLGWFPVNKTWSVQRKEDEELRQVHIQVIENLKEINDKLKDTQMKFDSKIEQVITQQPDDEVQFEYND